MEGGPWQMRLTLSDLLAVQHSSNLRDLLGCQEEEEDGGHQALFRRRGETLTLASALAHEKGGASSTPAAAGGRTLLDIFREDESLVAAGAGDNFSWMAFEDHLRLSAALAASTSRDPPSTNGAPPTEETLPEESADSGDNAAVPAAADEQRPVRVSLMALLEATEGQMGSGGEVWAVAEEDDDEEEDMTGGEEVQDSHVCCVCAERRKGAAFIPCGHTFCRVCSRVLFKRRGSCPLCNVHIVQVLRIF